MSKASVSSEPVKARKKPARKPSPASDDRHYDEFLAIVRKSFSDACASEEPLLQVNTTGLYSIYMNSMPAEFRQQHTCHACRRFFDEFGGIVRVRDSGSVHSLLWDHPANTVPPFYRVAVERLRTSVAARAVTGVFLSQSTVLGTPKTGEWSHLSVELPAQRTWKSKVMSVDQKLAERAEDFKNVLRALQEYHVTHLQRVVTWLESDALYRAENVLGPAKWLLERAKDRESGLNRQVLTPHGAENLLWRAIATAPAGFCHPRASMVGTLLDDVTAGVDFDAAAGKFKVKMNPLSYQRPQAAPKAGTIDQAEKLFEQLDLARSLPRRLCRDSDIQGLWYPSGYQGARRQQVPRTGVFADVEPRGAKPGGLKLWNPDTPANTITWVKFAATVLPNAVAIEHLVKDSFATFTTAVNEDAEPILMWDRPDARNPVAWMFWNGHTDARDYGLRAGTWQPVDIIALSPRMWYDGNATPGKPKGVMFIIRGAKAADRTQSCGGLFPENLRPELHGVRAVLEAKKGVVEGADNPHVCGVFLQDTSGSGAWNAKFRVKSANGSVQDYNLDRWD